MRVMLTKDIDNVGKAGDIKEVADGYGRNFLFPRKLAVPALRGVDDLGHVLAGEVEDVRIVVLVEEALDLVGEGDLLWGEVEVHGAPGRASKSDEASV